MKHEERGPEADEAADAVLGGLAQTAPLLRMIIDSTFDSICAIDPDYCLLLFNRAYDRGFRARFAREPRIGMNVLDVFGDNPSEQKQVREWWARALAGEAYSLLREGAVGSGKKTYYDVRFAPIRDAEGRRTGAISVTREITELVETRQALATSNEQLREANEALEDRNQELQNFAYLASHDLREPLRKMRVFADLVAEDLGERVDDENRNFLSRIQQASTRMMRLLDDLLAFSRVETHGVVFEKVDLENVVHEAIAGLREHVESSGAQIEIGPLPELTADPKQMRHLFQRIIENSVKFRREDVPLRVHIVGETVETDRGPSVRLLVEDNGIGFEDQYSDRIFAPFKRLHGRSEYDGTGMGLAIARRIVQRHRGHISARSAPGHGATLEIVLPIGAANEPPPAPSAYS